jgi:hypothetical protein
MAGPEERAGLAMASEINAAIMHNRPAMKKDGM